MKDKHLVWQACLTVIGLCLVTACGEQPPTPTPLPTAAPTVAGLITPGPGTATPPCQVTPPPGWGAYTVQRGDTLLGLAAGRGVTVEQVRRANCLTSNVLVADTFIYLPLFPTPTPCRVEVPAGWAAYQVQTGNTLFSLATKRQTTVAEIEQVNCLTAGAMLAIGQTLYLPLLPTPTPTSTPIPPPPPPTPRPTPMFPLVTAAPGIVSLPTMPPIQVPGQQQTGAYQLEAENTQANSMGGQGDQGNDQDSTNSPGASAAQLGGGVSGGNLDSNDLPELIYYVAAQAGSDCLNESSSVPTVLIHENILCIVGMSSFNEPITITLTSPDKKINLLGSFNSVGNWRTVPLEGVNAVDVMVIPHVEQVSAPPGVIITNEIFLELKFALPTGLPTGNWSVTVDISATASVTTSFDRPVINYQGPSINLFLASNRLYFFNDQCIVLSLDEVKQSIKIVDNNIPLGTPIGFYYPTKDGYLLKTKMAKTDKPIILSIDPTDIFTGSNYYVVAATNPGPYEPILPGEKGVDIWRVGQYTCFVIGFPQATAALPGDELPAPGSSSKPTRQQPGVASQEIFPPALTPTRAQEAVNEPTKADVRVAPAGSIYFYPLVILGLLGVVGIIGWLWVRRQRS